MPLCLDSIRIPNNSSFSTDAKFIIGEVLLTTITSALIFLMCFHLYSKCLYFFIAIGQFNFSDIKLDIQLENKDIVPSIISVLWLGERYSDLPC